jgi:hypothetical protein
MFVRLLLIALACRTWAANECISAPDHREGSVHVAAFAFPGEPIVPVYADLVDNSTLKRIQSTNRGLFEHLRYGDYRIRIQSPGFASKEVLVRLDEPALRVRVQLEVGMSCHSQSGLTGTLFPPRPGHNVWVKIAPVRGSGGMEAEVSPVGVFEVSGLDSGQYLIVVMDYIQPIYSGVVLVSGETKARIDLLIPSKPALAVSH